MKKILLSLLILSTPTYAQPTALASAQITNVPNTKILTAAHVRSHHIYTVTNDTPGDKMFYVKATLCPVDQRELCVEKKEQIGLSQGQFYTHDIDLGVGVVFQSVGDHSIIATTEVTGGANATAQQQKYVWVHY